MAGEISVSALRKTPKSLRSWRRGTRTVLGQQRHVPRVCGGAFVVSLFGLGPRIECLRVGRREDDTSRNGPFKFSDLRWDTVGSRFPSLSPLCLRVRTSRLKSDYKKVFQGRESRQEYVHTLLLRPSRKTGPRVGTEEVRSGGGLGSSPKQR